MITTFKYIFEGWRDLLLLVAAQSAERDETWVGRPVDHLLDGEFEDFFDGRPVCLIGLAFDSATRQLVDAAWERG